MQSSRGFYAGAERALARVVGQTQTFLTFNLTTNTDDGAKPKIIAFKLLQLFTDPDFVRTCDILTDFKTSRAFTVITCRACA